MSVRTELEELVKWISKLSAKDEPKPSTQLPRQDWQAIDRLLHQASSKFTEVRVALLAKDAQSFLAEFARDLERETEGLIEIDPRAHRGKAQARR